MRFPEHSDRSRPRTSCSVERYRLPLPRAGRMACPWATQRVPGECLGFKHFPLTRFRKDFASRAWRRVMLSYPEKPSTVIDVPAQGLQTGGPRAVSGPRTDSVPQCLILESKLIANSFPPKDSDCRFLSQTVGRTGPIKAAFLPGIAASVPSRPAPPGPPSAWPLTPPSFRPRASSCWIALFMQVTHPHFERGSPQTAMRTSGPQPGWTLESPGEF